MCTFYALLSIQAHKAIWELALKGDISIFGNDLL